MSSAASNELKAFRLALAQSKNVAILAGAGLSAGSGIPTFRGPNGYWLNNDTKKLASPEGFKDDPVSLWKFHHDRRETCLNAVPNAAHTALASLTIPGIRERLLPGLKDLHLPPLLITQNFDGLSSRALDAVEGQLSKEEMNLAKERLIEMHGNVFRQTCLQCKHISVSHEHHLASSNYADDRVVTMEDLPRCGGPGWNGSNRYGRCGGSLRPAVVWWGEIPEGMGDIARYLNWTDMLIVVGTSSLVYPAAGFAKTVKDRGGKVAIFNLDPSKGDDNADFLFLGKCEEVLPRALDVNLVLE